MGFHIICYNKLRRIGEYKKTGGVNVRCLERVEVPNLAQAANSELFVAVTGRIRHTIPSIYAQRLLMGLKYNAAKQA